MAKLLLCIVALKLLLARFVFTAISVMRTTPSDLKLLIGRGASQQTFWGDWGDWSSCDCNGKHVRTRECYSYNNHGHHTLVYICLGPDIDTESCDPIAIICHPVMNTTHSVMNTTTTVRPTTPPGAWTTWMDLTNCSEPCSNSIRIRVRNCTNVEYTKLTNECLGNSVDYSPCPQINCTDQVSLMTTTPTVVWNTWSDWSNCSEPCSSSTRVRVRNCTNAEYTHQTNDCKGHSVESLPCPDVNCTSQVSVMTTTPTDFWTNWSSWSYCTLTCGGGITYRSRNCSMYNHSQANDCLGNSVETKMCNNFICDVVVMNTSASVIITPGSDSSEQSTTKSESHDTSTSHHSSQHAVLEFSTLSTIVSNTTTPASVTIAPGSDSNEHSTTTPASHAMSTSHPGSPHAVLEFSTLSTIVSNTTTPASVTIAPGSDSNEHSTTTPASHKMSTSYPGSPHAVLDFSTLSTIVSNTSPASVTIAPGSDSNEHSTTTPASHAMSTSHPGSQAHPTTANTTPVTTNAAQQKSISCFECTDDPSGCEYNYQPVTCSSPNNYCINDLTNNGDASRVIIRRCGNYDECVNDWWQTYSDNELCKNFNQDTPYNVAFNCKFCCVKDACNEKINPPKETNFVKN